MKKIIYIFILLLTLNLNAQEENNPQDVNILLQKGYTHFYTNQDSAYYYFNKIKDIYIKKEEWENVIASLVSINRIASYNYNLSKMRSNLNALDSIFNNHEAYLKTVPNYTDYQNSYLYDTGIYHFETNNYKVSKQVFQKIITQIEQVSDSLITKDAIDLLSGSYNFIAKMNSEEGKYDIAKQFYNKNIRFISKTKPDDKASLYANYSLLADLLRRTKDYNASNGYFKKALNYNLNNQGNKNSIISISQILALNHINLKQPDSAKLYLDILSKNLTDSHPFWNKYYDIKAELYKSEQNDSLALQAYKTALKLTQDKWQNKPHPEIATYYQKIGLLYAANKQHKKAIENFNSGINILTNKIDAFSNKSLLVKLYKDKAAILNAENTTTSYNKSIQTVNSGIKTLDSLKPSFKSEADKLLLIEDAFPLFESGMEATYNLYESSLNQKYIEQAFFYSEKSKNILLFEALLSAKATRFGAVPENLLEQEKQLKSEISSLEKRLNSKKQVTDLEREQLFQLKESYRQHIKTIETNYKSYYDLKYNTQVSSLKNIQNDLKNDTVLVSYFFGTNALYIISIDKNACSFNKVLLSNHFNESIVSTYKDISNPKSDIKVLAKNTYNLYNTILNPIASKNKDYKNLVIIPDGLLNYIPFGSLNTEKDGLHYLIQDKTISYSNSATLFFQLLENKKENNALLAFAPSFTNPSNENLLPLPNNKKEAESILSYFGGVMFSGNNATLKNFDLENQKFGMLHLATHAIVNDANPEFSYLAFEPVSNQEHLLYVSDLYNLNLDVNLVTLSACESGIGNLKRGEGFMSLARGFYFSGASSIASTLWKINDGTSSEIMARFYELLSKGKTKNEALQKAKLFFIKENNENNLSHPYYWSGFVISGNTTAITNTNYFIWILSGMAIFIFLGFVIYRKKRS